MERRLDYTITYTAHRTEDRVIKCSYFEDAERVAQFLADIPEYEDVILSDGQYTWLFCASRRADGAA